MDRLWSPWRAKYIASGVDAQSSTCVFCEIGKSDEHDNENFVVFRGQLNFVVLNLFPYITGHLLIVPFAHVGEFDSAPKDVTDEMMDLAKRCQTALREVYKPAGYNLGMNLGAAAGAGIVDHIHVHILPRWAGDTNFMTTVAETRVLPESLEGTYAKLREQFR
ncbi:MAG TPA: HIT domain-containing protein [Pyrinomonadaceae bacterium]|nr:HIT domain-containing protein [Pyrinomonadaceae bacterium]